MSPAAAHEAMRGLGTPVRPPAAPWNPSAALILAVVALSAVAAVGIIAVDVRRNRRRK